MSCETNPNFAFTDLCIMCKKWRRKRLGRLAKLVQVTPGNEFASSDLLSPAAKGGETEPQLSAAACNLIGLDMT